MKIYYEYDENGFYLSHNYYDKKPKGNCTDVHISETFIKPRFNGSEWIEGATDEEILNAREIPEKVPLWCLLQQLKEDGLYELAIEKLNELPEPYKGRANTFLQNGKDAHRNSPTIEMLGALLEKNKTEIDTLFINADKLEL